MPEGMVPEGMVAGERRCRPDGDSEGWWTGAAAARHVIDRAGLLEGGPAPVSGYSRDPDLTDGAILPCGRGQGGGLGCTAGGSGRLPCLRGPRWLRQRDGRGIDLHHQPSRDRLCHVCQRGSRRHRALGDRRWDHRHRRLYRGVVRVRRWRGARPARRRVSDVDDHFGAHPGGVDTRSRHHRQVHAA